jgi:hypothetical protein
MKESNIHSPVLAGLSYKWNMRHVHCRLGNEDRRIQRRSYILEHDRREKKYLAIYSLIRDLISTYSVFNLL